MWNIKGFLHQDPNILNPRVPYFNGREENILRYEFPLFQWSIARVESVFGESILIVRLCIFLLGLATVYFFYRLLLVLGLSDKAALSGAIFFQFSPVFFYYTLNPIPDNLALFGGVVYLYHLFAYIKSPTSRHLLWATSGLLLATLAKLPFLMFSIVSIIYFANQLFSKSQKEHTGRSHFPGILPARWKEPMTFAAVQMAGILPALIWYAYVMPGWKNNGIVKGIFLWNMSAEEFWHIAQYHLTTMFPLLLLNPISLLFFFYGLAGLKKMPANLLRYVGGLIGITFLYLLLEFNMIGTIHDYYMMPFLPWLYIMVALGTERWLSRAQASFRKNIWLASLLLAPFLTFFMRKNDWTLHRTYYNHDLFIHQKALKEAVPSNEQCIIIKDPSRYVFAYKIDKMGYIYPDKYLPIRWIDDLMRKKNIRYMYSDVREVDEHPEFAAYIDSLLLEAGSIRVFRLKLPEKKK